MYRWIAPLLAVVIGVVATPRVSACQYAVRDVGFVSLADEPYRLTIVLPSDSTPAQLDDITATAKVLLERGHFAVEVGRIDHGGVFADAAAIAGGTLPVAVVTSPDGQKAVLTPDGLPLDKLEDTLRPLVESPARRGLAQTLIDSFGTVLLIEGTDAEANQRARVIAEDAIGRINSNKQRFDRVLEVGPSLRVIRAAQRGDEQWLLWSLGIAQQPQAEPEIAILFGQGRRLGPVLQGDSLTPSKLYSHLAIIAQDCECDLDRAWLYGQRFPLVWTDSHRQRTYDALGFDPESALVRAEVSRIISRGSSAGGIGNSDPFVDDGGIGGLGLQIYDLNDNTPDTSNTNASPQSPTTPAASTEGHPAANTPNNASRVIADTSPASSNPLPIALITLGALGLLVGVGATVMIVRSRGASA